MNVRSDSLNTRWAILLSGTMLIAAIPLCGALAQTPSPVGPNATGVESGWEYYGEIEAGGKIIIDGPPSGFGRVPGPPFWLTPQTTQSRAKFEEFGEIKSGFFIDYLNLGAATKDGRYIVDFWGQNIGRNNQFYSLDIVKPGEHYLMLQWDQIPHLISTSAKTIFSGAGTTFLAVDNALQAALQANACAATGGAVPPAGCVVPGGLPNTGQHARANIESLINGAATNLTLSTLREKASIAYRNTPTDSWDFRFSYSNEHRTGTRPVNINWGYGFNANPGFASNFLEVPQPIDDRTHIINASAQYVGTTPWDTRWIASLKYSGSFYENSLKQLDVENPFCIGCVINAGANRAPSLLRLGLAPSNMANAFTFNSVLNLPGKSRWTNTLQYNMMRQNDPFVVSPSLGTPGLVIPADYPTATSANAKVDTFLAYSVLTTEITNNLKSTLRYRYYDVQNNTPELLWGAYMRADSGIVTTDRRNLAIAYTKQNASAELNWRAMPWLTLGAIYLWEQYDRTRRDVNVTNEHSGKFYIDAGLWDAAKLRANVMYAARRYDNYDALAFVDVPGLLFSEVPPQVRKFDIANRDRIKAEAFMDIPIGKSMTVTPNFGLRFDSFPTDVVNQLGVKRDNAWNAGIEFSAKLNTDAQLMLAYNYEHHNLYLDASSLAVIPANIWSSDITQHYHTVIAAFNWKAVPGKLDFKFEYLLALASEANDTRPCLSGLDACTGGGVGVTTTQFPIERNNFQRFSVLARYFVDPDVVRRMGWKGDVVVKARYIFERNQNTNWATDTLTPYVPTEDQTTDLTGGGRSLFLAAMNPNYTAHIVMMALGIKW